MNTHRMMNRGIVMLLVAALATTTFAPAAQADRHNRRGGRYDRGPVHVIRRGPVIVERHSDAGAVFGFLGGLVLGTVIANAQQAPPPPPAYDYRYHDRYCDRSFATLGAYEDHLYRHRHPQVAEVIVVGSGRCVEVVRWRDGRWMRMDDYDEGARCPVVHPDAPAYEPWDD